jgi:hypothetical protein
MIQRITLCLAAAVFAGATLLAQTSDMTGQWEVVYNPPSGHVNATLYVQQSGTTIKGNAETEGGEFPLSGSVNGKAFTISYTRPDGGRMVTTTYKGTVEGDEMKDATAQLTGQEPVPLEGDRTSR